MGRNDILRLFLPFAAVVCAFMLSCNAMYSPSPSFDAGRSFKDLEAQVAFGSRVPGSPAHLETRDWIVGRMKELTDHVSVQPFTGLSGENETEMFNVVASFYPEKPKRVLLCAHWDCRPWADKDPDSKNHTHPVPGANDGASGVAVLMEIARIIVDNQPTVGIDMAFFDGEDGGAYGETESWLLGSRHFADVMPASYRPKYAILLDMIGDADLSITRDGNSMLAAPGLWKRVRAAGEKHGVGFSEEVFEILDDHVPLITRGIPAIDLIDFEYEWWHTIEDTPDKCSPESLGKIGSVVLEIIYAEE